MRIVYTDHTGTVQTVEAVGPVLLEQGRASMSLTPHEDGVVIHDNTAPAKMVQVPSRYRCIRLSWVDGVRVPA